MSHAPQTVTASAPGSIMITGEHAVVYGHRAIVAAIDQRVQVTLTRRTDETVRITSEIADPLVFSRASLPSGGPYRFVLAALSQHREQADSGFDMDIRSDINPTLGLGSSAAVTIACLGALSHLVGAPREGVHGDALRIVRRLQGRGSGADLAASFHGGLMAYRAPAAEDTSATVTPLQGPDAPLSLKYAGYKTPTAEVLRMIAERRSGQEAHYDALYARMGTVADKAISAAENKQWPAFFAALTTYQSLMADLGVSDDTLDHIIANANEAPGTLAAKISGSGLGDCVLAFGAALEGFDPVNIAAEGLCVDG